MNIVNYIKELILANECIIIPDLGGFETHYQSAKVNPSNKVFSPPTKYIRFRSDLKKDNGVLLNYIIKKEKITKEKAEAEISTFVKGIKDQLEQTGRVILEEIGELVRQTSGHIMFEPVKGKNFLIDSFGLMEFEMPDDKPKEQIPAKKMESNRTTNNSNKTAIWIAISILLVGIAGLVYFLIKNNTFNHIKLFESDRMSNLFSKNKTEEVTVEFDTIETALDAQTQQRNALIYQTEESQSIPTTKPDIPTYHIIIGSFKKIDNARAYQADLGELGYKPKIIEYSNGFYLVTLKSYTDKQEAIKEWHRLKNNTRLGAWILTV